MIIDGYRFAKYLSDTGLKAEEFWLLYRIMLQEQNIVNSVLRLPVMKKGEVDSSLQFSQWSQKYQEEHSETIAFVTMCKKLQKEGYVKIWEQEDTLETLTEIKLTKIQVTEKFKSFFLLSDIEKAFIEVLELYPNKVWVKGVFYASKDKPPNVLRKLYDEHILKGGNLLFHERFMMITKMYFEQNDFGKDGASHKLSNWITEAFHGVADIMERKDDQDSFTEEL